MNTRHIAVAAAACASLALPALAGGPPMTSVPEREAPPPVTSAPQPEAPQGEFVELARLDEEPQSIAVGPMDLGNQQIHTDEGYSQAAPPAVGSQHTATSTSPYAGGSTGLRPVWIPAQAKAEVTVLQPGEEAFGGAGDLIQGDLVQRSARELILDTPEGRVPVRYDSATRFEGVSGAGKLAIGQPVTAVVDQRGNYEWGLLISTR